MSAAISLRIFQRIVMRFLKIRNILRLKKNLLFKHVLYLIDSLCTIILSNFWVWSLRNSGDDDLKFGVS